MAGTAVAPGAGERVQGPAGLVPMGVGALALVYHLQDCDHDPVSSEVGVWWAVGAPACLLPACGLLPQSCELSCPLSYWAQFILPMAVGLTLLRHKIPLLLALQNTHGFYDQVQMPQPRTLLA